MFEPAISGIKKKLVEIVEKANKDNNTPTKIVLVGGFSTSEYVQRDIKKALKPLNEQLEQSSNETCKYNRVIVDKDPLFTVLKGR